MVRPARRGPPAVRPSQAAFLERGSPGSSAENAASFRGQKGWRPRQRGLSSMDSDTSKSSSEATARVQKLFIKDASLIKAFITSLLPDFGLVDDVLHEVFLVVTQKADSFEPGSSFTAWAFAIAKLKVLEVCRAQTRQCGTLAPEVIESLCAAVEPEALVQLNEDRRIALESCIEDLTPRARDVIRMRYREAHRPAEIARRIGWTADSVYVALSRARAALRACVERKLAAIENM